MAKRRCLRVLAPGLAALALLLLAPGGALAVKAPGLASSTQYKAFIEYVKKLDGLTTQPTSAEQKNTYEAKLTAKKTAAAHKANALFKRASEEAEAEANEAAKEQAEQVRAREGKALEALRVETNSKLERTESSFHHKFERIATGHKNREKALKTHIAELRAKKAAAAPGTPKTRIQEQIEKVSGEVTANRADEKEKRKALKAAVTKQREQIKSKAEAKETEIGEAADETVKKIDNHWNNRYLSKKEALNKTRESRLGYLEQKLEQGRADIAAMPVSG
jgi:chromosome segregation ATPase